MQFFQRLSYDKIPSRKGETDAEDLTRFDILLEQQKHQNGQTDSVSNDPLLHSFEGEDITGTDVANLYSSIWFSRWMYFLGIRSTWRTILYGSFLWLWTIWQGVLNGIIGSRMVGDKITMGSPAWFFFPLYGACAYSFMWWYMNRRYAHFKALTEKPLLVSASTAQDMVTKVNRNAFLAVLFPFLFFIAGIVKTAIAISDYRRTHIIPYFSIRKLGGGAFITHALIEPFATFFACLAVTSCFLLFDSLGWVHSLDLRLFRSQLVRLSHQTSWRVHQKNNADENGEVENRLHVTEVISKHHTIRMQIRRTERLWAAGILISAFFGTIFAVISIAIMLTWHDNQQWDVITPIALLLFNMTVFGGYLLTLAYVNHFAHQLSGYLYINSLVTGGDRIPINFMLQIEYLENYLRNTDTSLSPIGVSVTYKTIMTILFVLGNSVISLLVAKFKAKWV